MKKRERERVRVKKRKRERVRESETERERDREQLFSWLVCLLCFHVHGGNAINKCTSWDTEKTLQVLFLATVVNDVIDKRT